MYSVSISRMAEKQLSALPKPIANSITAKIDALAADPRPAGCKKLQGSENEYRIRSGDYRVLYRIEDNRLYIDIIRIGHRSDIYKKR